MAKYGKKAQEKVEETMHEMKQGKLKSGSGKKVTSRKQAVAIGLSEARKAGGKVPSKKTSSKAKKKVSGGTKKTAAKKSSAKKSSATKKTSSKKSATKKSSSKKTTSKKRTTKTKS